MANTKKILIIGGGGREHAVGWKVAQSPNVAKIYFAPGNGGTALLGENVPIAATDISALLEFAKKESIDLTLALPDDPLALGVVDEFRKAGLKVWGATKAAAQLESSKAFAKDFMKRHNLPTARFETFTDFEKAKAYVAGHSLPVVVKASGLALGKGVIICQTHDEAYEALENMLVKKVFGESGSEVVVEEFLTGPEISVHAFSDGKNCKMFPSSQDHKRIGEGNTGLNTGGMGTIAPVPFVSGEMMTRIEKEIIAPTLSAMTADGMPFEGLLFPGLMLTSDGPKVIEYNARFGDPETESYMRLLDTDILEVIEASLVGTLDTLDIKWKSDSIATIILASGGYPEKYEKGKVITGIEEAEKVPNVVVFHCGTKRDGDNLVTNGGRVLAVSAIAGTLEEALITAYTAVEKIHFEGMQYRKDIGKSALGQGRV